MLTSWNSSTMSTFSPHRRCSRISHKLLSSALNRGKLMRHIVRMERARTQEQLHRLLGEYYAVDGDTGMVSQLAATLPELSGEWQKRFHAASTREFREPDMIQIFVKTLSVKPITILVDRNLPVGCLKEQIYEKEGIPFDQQRLVSGGRQLIDRYTLAHYNIRNEATIHLVLRLVGCVCGCTQEVLVQWTAKNREFSVEAGCRDSVETLKERIAAETGVPGQKQALTFDGMVLDEDEGKTLGEYGICGNGHRVELRVDQDSI